MNKKNLNSIGVLIVIIMQFSLAPAAIKPLLLQQKGDGSVKLVSWWNMPVLYGVEKGYYKAEENKSF
ncbi:MAG: hypothetical protein IPL71_22405 [Anaerolineales bacterium]|uniref:hypothetical protein n=1 Tax=Candidatus Villigracilis proximus TaxID=3140683 RepID=UPI003136FCC7|nr:hypothetical protein [Anaerolineales bacterium]